MAPTTLTDEEIRSTWLSPANSETGPTGGDDATDTAPVDDDTTDPGTAGDDTADSGADDDATDS